MTNAPVMINDNYFSRVEIIIVAGHGHVATQFALQQRQDLRVAATEQKRPSWLSHNELSF
jgi:hypothetical protein